MKKIFQFAYILFVLLLCSCGADSNVWKDTHTTYGNGTYQVFNHKKDGESIKGISNSICHQCIVDKIIALEENDTKVYVYGEFTGHEVFTVIDTTDNIATYFVKIEPTDVLGMTNINELISSGTFVFLEKYEDFSEEDKEFFSKIS